MGSQACRACGGVGRGSIDPEFGWRRGPVGSDGQPAPCPECQKTVAKNLENGAYDTVNVKTGKVVKATEAPPFGPYIDPQDRKPRDRSIAVVDDPNASPSTDEFDPGVVNTGSEKVTIDQAVAMAGAGEE
jgi:hypothetical protein